MDIKKEDLHMVLFPNDGKPSITSGVERLDHTIIKNNSKDAVASTLFTTNPFDLISYQNAQVKYKISGSLEYISSDKVDKLREDSASIVKTLAGITEDEVKEIISKNDEDIVALENVAKKAPVVRLVNAIIQEAYQRRASDVHLEATSDSVSLRYRIDGVLYEQPSPPRSLVLAIVSRIKILAGLNIAEKRLPQDGRFSMSMVNGDLDVRVATIPSIYGESISIRLLDKTTAIRRLDELGISQYDLDRLKSFFTYTHGMILVTGPTGGGKTTTLYSMLQELISSERKIVTLEDPIEYEITGVTQTQVQPKIGFSFANGLRSLLRHDPDIILVGEIRDRETAEMAIHASLTGHLVLSSLHTNDAPGAITRLLDMGVEPFLISSSLRAVLSQRLVRRVCPNCHSTIKQDCSICSGTGFSGRTAIAEFMQCDNWLQIDLLSNIANADLRRLAIEHGMRSMQLDGEEKVARGITNGMELQRVLGQS